MQTISRKVSLVGSFLFLLTSNVQIIQPAVGESFRTMGSSVKKPFLEKLPGLISRTRSHLAQKIRSSSLFDREKIVDSLLKNVVALGKQVGDMKTCMMNGKQCSARKRTAFYATAVTVLALTALAVGFTIAAATSKEADEELNFAMQQTSQEVQGWSPQDVFKRLKNKLSSFRMNLIGMKECLITRRCTKAQKRSLYTAAATIVVLVTIAIGLGIGSYIYAEKQKQKEQDRQRQVDLEAAREKVRKAEQMKEKSATEAEQQLAEQDLRSAQEEIEKLLALAQFDDNPAEATGFRKHVNILKGKAQKLKTAYDAAREKTNAEIRELLQDIKARTGKKRIDLKKRIAAIKEQAFDAFADKLGRTKEFFNTIIQETVGVNAALVWEKMKETKAKFDKMRHLFVGKSKEKIVAFNRGINDFILFSNQVGYDFNTASEAMAKLSTGALLGAKFKSYKTLATQKTKLAQQMASIDAEQAQIRARLDEIGLEIKKKKEEAEKYAEEIVQLSRKNNDLEGKRLALEAQKEQVEYQYEIKRITMDYLDEIYSSAIVQVNSLDLRPFGWAINKFFRAFGKTIALVGNLPKHAGLEFILPSANAEQSIQEITRGIYSFGSNLKEALSIQPIITTQTRKLKSLVADVIRASTNPMFVWETTKGTFNVVKTNLPTLKEALRTLLGNLGVRSVTGSAAQTLAVLEHDVSTFLKEFSVDDLKREFVQKIRKAPISNIPRAPKILLSIVEKTMKPLRKPLQNALKESTGFIEAAISSIPPLFQVLYDLNYWMKLTEKEEPFFNQKIMEAIGRISVHSIGDLKSGTSRLLRAIAAPAA